VCLGAADDRATVLSMNDEIEMSMSVPLDSDGFLRRECPTCEREFKWLPAQDDAGAENASPVPAGGYFCPYCVVQAPSDAWFTKAQIAYAEAIVMREAVVPELEKLKDTAARSSGDFVQIDVDYDEPEEPRELIEDDDMRRVDFACHVGEPIKVLDEWSGSVHCLVCGQPTK
jgi:hypothetical protein